MGTMNKRISGLLILLAGYIVAIGASVGLYFGLAQAGLDLFLNLLICDVAATIIIWLFGVLFKTASFYDPYWSVQTFVMVLAILISSGNWNAGTILFLVALAYYTVRLTGNFIRTFHSLRYVDWRYEMLREKSGKLFQIVNLMGICMFPTLIVYLASIPALYVALGNFSWWQIIGFVVMVGAVTLELIQRQTDDQVREDADRSQPSHQRRPLAFFPPPELSRRDLLLVRRLFLLPRRVRRTLVLGRRGDCHSIDVPFHFHSDGREAHGSL